MYRKENNDRNLKQCLYLPRLQLFAHQDRFENFHVRTVRLDVIEVILSQTNAQVNCLKNDINISFKIAPTCFGVVTQSSGSSLSVLAKVTL